MLVLAADNDPEGELIAYETLLDARKVLGYTPRYSRMRFNAATPSELRRAWETIESDLKWNWVWKALLRHKFDLITGAAYTRLLTLSRGLSSGDKLVSWGSCVRGDTIIPGDYKPISKMDVGDHCIGLILSDNRVIKKFIREYNGQLIRIKALGLLPIELTPEHPVLTASTTKNSGGGDNPLLFWKPAAFLTPKDGCKNGDYLVLPCIRGTININKVSLNKFAGEEVSSQELPLDEEVLWLLGAYVANGISLGDSVQISINLREPQAVDRIIGAFKKLSCSYFIVKRWEEPARKISINIHSQILLKAFTEWFGEKDEQKRIPDFILLHENLDLVKAFLEGYEAGSNLKAQCDIDAKNSAYATIRSKILALQLQLLYARLGYFLQVYEKRERDRDEADYNATYTMMLLEPNPKNAEFHVLNGHILTPIIEVESIPYWGLVYNLETSDNTYLVSNAVVHNCQIPTLWFVYQREMEIRDFKPEKYYVISALLDAHGVKITVASDPIRDANMARQIYNVAKGARYALVKDFQLKDEIEHKPLPTETDIMLQELSKIMGLSATKIMALAEMLYGEGYISYPRTETNMWLTVDHKSILHMLSSTPLGRKIDTSLFNPKDGRKNDGAHPPIYPTAYYPGLDDRGKIWEYISRRYLANVVGKDAILKRWKLNVDLGNLQMDATGRYFVDEGFYQIFPYFKPRELTYIPQLRIGERLPVIKVALEERETKPPPRLTETELLKLLEKNSIGTDATRADYPQIIVERGYVEKRRRSFYISILGENLINLLKDVDERLVTPNTRRYVEHLMAEVEAGRINMEKALDEALKIYEELFDKVSIKLKTLKNNNSHNL
jgi:DNA topoisomerase IA/intein/homing endonuclease